MAVLSAALTVHCAAGVAAINAPPPESVAPNVVTPCAAACKVMAVVSAAVTVH